MIYKLNISSRGYGICALRVHLVSFEYIEYLIRSFSYIFSVNVYNTLCVEKGWICYVIPIDVSCRGFL